MPLEFTMTLAGNAGDKNAVSQDIIVAPPGVRQIQCRITDTVDVLRRVEIMNSWKWLYRGLAERGVLTQFAGNIVYTAVPLNNRTSPARKTSSTPDPSADGDVVISLGLELVTPVGSQVWLEQAFDQLFDYANEQALWELS